MCDSGSLVKGVVDFSGGMGIGMKSGYSCNCVIVFRVISRL